MIAYALINLMMFRKAILYSKINLCKRLHPGSNPHTLMSEIQRKDPHISANFNPKCQFIIVKDLLMKTCMNAQGNLNFLNEKNTK